MRFRFLISLSLAIAVATLAACSKKDEPPPPPKEKQGRAETQSIRNTEAVGYSGSAIANKIDDALKKNDEQVRKTEKAADENP